MFTRETWQWFLPFTLIFLAGCKQSSSVLNQPYLEEKTSQKIWHTSFGEPPVTLDPGRAYTVSATLLTGQIYEPPLQYHFLKRPFSLEPLLLTALPVIQHYDQWGQLLPRNENKDRIDSTHYILHLKKEILYADHPAFAKKGNHYRYHHLSPEALQQYQTLQDFTQQSTRAVTAQDLAYAIKRMASPKVNSPVYAIMAEHIVGLSKLREILMRKEVSPEALRDMPLDGVKVLDDQTIEIILNGQYPQFSYWLAMPFFAPVPWEAEVFYEQPGMKEKHLSLDWQPVGTGPYYLAKNDPSRIMVLEKNPRFHEEFFPSEGAIGEAHQYLALAGQRLPLVDRIVFSKETEAIPRWAKFQQGYYDSSAVIGDSFDQAIQLGPNGQFMLTDQLRDKGIRLSETVEPTFFYTGFNWLDPVVGGDHARKLRQAIAIALDYDEYIQVFLNGRGQRGLGPVPPGIEGYRALEDDHPIYEKVSGQWQRRSLDQAKTLLAEAGFPNGVDPKTGKALRLNFDVAMDGPSAAAYLAWMRKQFQKIGISLNVRNTHYNRFQKKMRQGKGQIFLWGWHADYPDPENFLFLFYGPNGKARYGGENAGNYENPDYDRWFLAMRDATPNSRERTMLLAKMQAQLAHDMPLVVNYYPIYLTLLQQWTRDAKPMPLTGNFMKYMDLDQSMRAKKVSQWNHASLLLIWLCLLGIFGTLVAVIWVGYQRGHRVSVVRFKERDE